MSYSTSICSFLSVFIQIGCLCQKVTEVLLLLITIISIEDHTGALLLIDWGNCSSVQVPIFRPERIAGVPNLPLCNTFQFTSIIWNSKSTQVLTLFEITSLSGAALHLFLLLLFLLFFRFFPGSSFLWGVTLSSPFNAFWWVEEKREQNNSRVTEKAK